MAVPKPDYLSRDYSGLRDSLLQFAGQSYPDWQPSSEGDFGMVMVELFAYFGDIISYYTDRAQFENYLPTATQRDSVLGIAYLLGYVPNSGTPAKGTVTLETDPGLPATVVPAGTKLTTNRIEALDAPVTFETDVDVTLAANGAANVATAVTEGETVSYAKIGESSGQPSQVFALPNTGVYRDTIRVFVEDGTGTTTINPGTSTPVVTREWLRVDHLLDVEENTPAFETQLSNDSTLINFGDDVNGAIPATGLQIFATYRHGVGLSGNVTAGQVRLINDRNLAGVHVRRDSAGTYVSSPMSGGADPESVESIRYNAPRAYRSQNRAITLQDYRDIALGVEGVSKANVVAGTFTSVTVFVTASDGGAPSEGLKTAVARRYDGRTLTGVNVSVASPTFIPVNFGSGASPVSIEVLPQYSQKNAKAAAERVIREYLSTLPFGEKLAVGKIFDVVSNVEGVRYVEIPVMARADAAQTGVITLTPRPWEVFTTGTVTIAMTGGTV